MQKSVAIIGGGSAALMLASHLDKNKFDVSIYEKNKALGRKFLVAGDGGFNLTHSEHIEDFILRYTPSSFLQNSLAKFSNVNLRERLNAIGIETYIGTSKRVFPIKGIKPIDVLNAFLNQFKKQNVKIFTQHTWKGWNNANELLFEFDNKNVLVKSDIVIFALGGASWSVTGSDGLWANYFIEKGINIKPFQASNCAYEIKWSSEFLNVAEGKVLKNISITCNNKTKKGEIVITKFGIEGGAIYALSPEIRGQLLSDKKAEVVIDLKPAISLEEIQSRLKNRGNKSITKFLKDELNLNIAAIELLKHQLSKEEYSNLYILSQNIKALYLIISSSAPIDEAISTVGGISLNEIDADFQIKKMPNYYVIGEMLDWDAPTGGYLLQACFSMGYCLAQKLNSSL